MPNTPVPAAGEAMPAVQRMEAAAIASAETTMKSIRNVANCLSAMMSEAHNADFRAVIDHEVEFILIRPYEPKSKPKPREAI